MLVFDSLETGPLMTNCYIVGDAESKKAAVVDPGGHVGAIRSALDVKGLSCEYILNTHAHFDHVGGNAELKKATGAKILIHEAEADWLEELTQHARMFGVHVDNSPPADGKLEEGQIIELGQGEDGIRLKVHHTPGHSPGSVSLVIEGEEKILVGDLVFAGSIGRTDLPGGDFATLVESVKTKIFIYSDETRLYSGHGPETSVGQERRSNPFLTGRYSL